MITTLPFRTISLVTDTDARGLRVQAGLTGPETNDVNTGVDGGVDVWCPQSRIGRRDPRIPAGFSLTTRRNPLARSDTPPKYGHQIN
jgi:hypothetical protein